MSERRAATSLSAALVLALVAMLASSSCRRAPVNEAVTPVSLASLIVAPARHDGDPVQVMGFLLFEPDHHRLFLTEEDATVVRDANGIAIDTKDMTDATAAACRALSRRYVMLSATAREDIWGRGILEDVRGVEAAAPREFVTEQSLQRESDEQERQDQETQEQGGAP